MNLANSKHALRLPESLEAQLYDYRRRVWTIKIVEAVCVAVFAVIVAFLAVFALDRIGDTPGWFRLGLFLAALGACAIVPWFVHRWVWRKRQLPQLARLLSHKLPHVGDQLLGVIELVEDESEQARSRTLCEAAVRQVAQDAKRRDLAGAMPSSRLRMWRLLASVSVTIAVGLAVFFPPAAGNAWARFLAPWQETPRYTFTSVQPLPEKMIVPHGEPSTLTVRLEKNTEWRPSEGEVRIGRQRPIVAQRQDDHYSFELPPQIDAGWLHLKVGDVTEHVRIVPMLRPELVKVAADIALPDYLGRQQPINKDVRGGAISLVRGSRVTFSATASRTLALAFVDGLHTTPSGATVSSPRIDVDNEMQIEFRWQDEFELSGKEPFTLSVTPHDDEPPSILCDGIPRRRVVLDSEQLRFRIRAHDDFGVRHVGMEWREMDHPTIANPAGGERILAGGGTEQIALDAAGTFTATSLGIEPQPIYLRVFVEDYFVDRERVYSPTYLLFVLSPEQHAIWLTEQLSKWHRQSLEVRDRELTLFETNKEIRDLPTDELDRPETRRQIQSQAAAERANGRRLARLTRAGEQLVREASKNSEFGVGHLEKWAQMLQILKDISANRMPTVAELLKDASQAESSTAESKKSQDKPPVVGQVRASGKGSPSEEPDEDEKKPPVIPQIVDVESSQQLPGEKSEQPAAKKKSGAPSLGLPSTTLIGGGPPDDACPADQKMEEAVTEQQNLLAEFERVADELNTILTNLEGSTLVKRLKSASREQYRIAGRIGDQLDEAFGLGLSAIAESSKGVFRELSEAETKGSYKVSLIMDDMHAYFERRRFMQFKTVLDDMNEQDVVGNLRELADEFGDEHGLSMAQCEYWSDSLDRWAEDLVDPASGGS